MEWSVIQNFINQYGLGMSVEEIAEKVYFYLVSLKYNPCIINERYIEVNGSRYRFVKSKKYNGWVAKIF